MSVILFSVDVEDAQKAADGASRVPAMIERYLDFLDEHRAKGTFFIVGQVARDHPDLVRGIASRGHEIGCHSDAHQPLHRQGRRAFQDDLKRAVEALRASGAPEVVGYRAPYLSLTKNSAWAYEVLEEEGFRYSSSVLPARSPLYGWAGFGTGPRMMGSVLELPITLLPVRLWSVPIAGGTYFRMLPSSVILWGLRRLAAAREPVVSYFHPYDVDEEDLDTAFDGHHRGGPVQWLLRYNRKSVFPRLRAAVSCGMELRPFAPHVADLLASFPAPGGGSGGTGKAGR